MKHKLAIVTTHPIQYNAPLFKLLAQRGVIDLKVFYTWGESAIAQKYDPGFKKVIDWDIPLLEGYEFEFLQNDAPDKGSHHFKGIINPNIIPAINMYSPDAILVFGWSFESHLKIIRYFKGKIPIIFRGDSTLLDKTPGFKGMIRAIALKWIYRHIDVALFVGKNNYNYFLKAGLKQNQLVYAPHAIDNDRFHSVAQSTADPFRKQLGIADDALVFLFAGKLEAKKDPELLIKAFLTLKFSCNAQLVVVGNGPLEEELRSRYKSNSTIHFVEFQNQSVMPLVYKMADVFVLPSKGPGETWGLALNEAMACGKAVIASDRCGASPDVIKSDVNGYVFKAGDIEDLKNALLHITTKQKASMLGTASLSLIKDFSIAKVAGVIEKSVLTLKSKPLYNEYSKKET